MKKRIIAVFVLISFLFLALCGRLFFIQIINGKNLQAKATDQWTRDLTLTAPRGTIYDSNGATLAVSYTTYNLYVRAREVNNPTEIAIALAGLFSTDFISMYEKVTKKNVSEVLIKQQISPELAEKIYNLKYDGLYLSENVGRYYPYGDLLTQVLGFCNIEGDGQSGVEAYFNDTLTGIDGYSYVQSDLLGKEIGGSMRYYVSGVSGNSLKLTIDANMEILLEQTLQKLITQFSPQSTTGMIIKADTLEIKALSIKPSFDLNEPPRDNLTALFAQSKVSAVTDAYEPGSTFKILTVAAALEEGLVTLNDRFYCPGYRIIDGQKIKCWKTTGHGSQTLVEAITNSCNCCFMDLALRLGVDKFYEYMEKFGLGTATGVTISGESSGILMNKGDVKTVDLARMGFGHAVAVTPMQLIQAVASVVNGGYLITPTIISSVIDENSNVIKEVTANFKTRVVSEKTSQTVNYLLQNVTNKLGDCTFVEGYNVGGKTGTAQKYSENGGIAQGKYISSFIGTYPADNPEYIVYIMVNEPQGAYYGSVVAAPYGKIVFERLFEYLCIPRDNDNVVLNDVIVPNFIGLSLSDAIILAKQNKLSYEVDGDGGIVTGQIAPEGSVLKEGDSVILIT